MPREWPNRGKPPRDKTALLGIRWGNGRVSKYTYTADQIKRWSITGDAHDVKTFWRTNGADDVEGERV